MFPGAQRTTMPEWAQQIVEECATDHELGFVPRVEWGVFPRSTTYRGICRAGGRNLEVAVGENHSEREAIEKKVLLHELAHAIHGKGRYAYKQQNNLRHTKSHTKSFYHIAFTLYDAYGIDREFALKYESEYMNASMAAFKERYGYLPKGLNRKVDEQRERSFISFRQNGDVVDVFYHNMHVGSVCKRVIERCNYRASWGDDVTVTFWDAVGLYNGFPTRIRAAEALVYEFKRRSNDQGVEKKS